MVVMEGDMGLPRLGLSGENREILINEVSVVFNGAASLRLEAGLKDAVRHNTTGTKHVLDLAVEMKNLVVYTSGHNDYFISEYPITIIIVHNSGYIIFSYRQN